MRTSRLTPATKGRELGATMVEYAIGLAFLLTVFVVSAVVLSEKVTTRGKLNAQSDGGFTAEEGNEDAAIGARYMLPCGKNLTEDECL